MLTSKEKMHTLSEIKAEMKELSAQMEEDLKTDWRARAELQYNENCFLDKQEAKRKEEKAKEDRKRDMKRAKRRGRRRF